jgi:hypothetical protein
MTETNAEIRDRNAEAIHDMSMDKEDPIRAATGRCLKYINPALEEWIINEQKVRGTILSEIVLGLAEGLGLLLGSVVSGATKKSIDSADQYEARWTLGINIAMKAFELAAMDNPHLQQKGTPTNERT